MHESLTGKKRRGSMSQPPEMSEVNVMLLGSVGVGKSTSGNTIIGVQTFEEGFSLEAVTRTCELAQTEVDGQTITVIDTVGLSDTDVKITDAQTEIEQILRSTDIDVFLLVINLGQSFRHHSKVVKWIQENFGAKILKHTIVLFTHGDLLQGSMYRYLRECKALRSVVDQCYGGFHVFNNRDEDQDQVTELLEKINRLRETNEYSRYTEQDYRGAQKNLATGAAGGFKVFGAIAAAGSALFTLGAAVVGLGPVAGMSAVAAGAGICLMASNYFSRRNG